MQHIETVQCGQISPQNLQQETKNMETSTALATTVQSIDSTGGPQAMTHFSLYNFDGFDVRIQDDMGKPWFVIKDVCEALGISHYRNALSRLDLDERASVLLNTPGGPQETSIINESGLYSLILTSRKPEARKFKKWVTSEVLPSIRKTGSYDSTLLKALIDSTDALNTSTEAVIQLSARNKDLQREKTVLQERTETLEQESEALKQEANENRPQLEAFQRLAGSKGTFSLTEAAKALKAPPRAFNLWLAANGWVYKRSSQQSWLGYQTKVNSELLTHKVTELPRTSDIVRTVTQVRVTPLGMTKLALLLEKKPIASNAA